MACKMDAKESNQRLEQKNMGRIPSDTKDKKSLELPSIRGESCTIH